MGILVYIQLQNNLITDFSYDLISGIKEISNGRTVNGVIVLPSDYTQDLSLQFENLRKHGLDKLYILKSQKPFFDKQNHPYLISELIKQKGFKFFILTASTEGREIAPIVASSLETGLTADCTKLEFMEDKLISTRPTFGGKLMASILCKKNPQMATVRKNTFKKKLFETSSPLEVEEIEFDVKQNEIEILEFKKDENNEFETFENAKLILGGGCGLKNKENFDKLKHLAKLMGAKVGATRKAVDKGFIEREFQIGQTGKSVTPEIYIAFGISGAIHHIMGIENSKKIIAINIDKNAPIFNHADVGIADDAIKILDELILKFS